MSKARIPFWLDGGYDFDLVQGCRYHPTHKWWTFRLGDVLTWHFFDGRPEKRDELFTICAACYVPRCGTTEDGDRCTLWRHHVTAHVYESGQREPVGGVGVSA